MIKSLKKKYVFTSMLAITILLVLLLGAINIINIVTVKQQVSDTLEIIARFDGDPGNLPGRDAFGDFPLPDDLTSQDSTDKLSDDNKKEFDNNFENDVKVPLRKDGRRKNDYDTFMSSNFFIVRYDVHGNGPFVDVSRTSTISEDEALTLAEEVLGREETAGKTGDFRYLVSESHIPGSTTVVFLDTSGEIGSYLRVLLISAFGGALCWLAMLILVLFLSEKAIRPIAENIERQRQFITDAGHEIKTPLAIIQSNTEAMELFNGENKWSKNIKNQTLRLSGLMQNLLLIAKMDEGELLTHAELFSLSSLANETFEGFREAFAQKGLSFDTNVTQEIELYGDRMRTSQLMSILLENALKYTDEGGYTKTDLQKVGGHAVFVCENSCVKVPDAAPEKLFDRFFRADSARTQSTGGYGIGLSAARKIAEASGGKIEAEYPSDTTIRFTVTLPIKAR